MKTKEQPLTVRQAAKRLRLTPLRVKQLCRTGLLRHFWTAQGRRIEPESLAEYARTRAIPTS